MLGIWKNVWFIENTQYLMGIIILYMHFIILCIIMSWVPKTTLRLDNSQQEGLTGFREAIILMVMGYYMKGKGA